ncbi:MAG TPA: hypothetical protein VJO52_10745 [Gemmatimonadaceae bacterium]|nr:hypothetical protein [Gemmatimonadaceae bacterium]
MPDRDFDRNDQRDVARCLQFILVCDELEGEFSTRMGAEWASSFRVYRGGSLTSKAKVRANPAFSNVLGERRLGELLPFAFLNHEPASPDKDEDLPLT